MASRRSFLIVMLTALISFISSILYGAINIRVKDFRVEEHLELGLDVFKLPKPKTTGGVSVEEAIARRRSIREYRDKPLAIEELSQILWAAQGITDPANMFRAAPSAGALYPLEVYVVVRSNGVVGLNPGIYKYNPVGHEIVKIRDGDFSYELFNACLSQDWVRNAQVNIVITAIYGRTTWRYGDRGRERYVHMEVGHVGENIYLQCVALGLGTVAVGAFSDDQVWSILGKPKDEAPLYVMPIGRV
jgi:SagB-type dehydrogenase family enzyme